MAAAAAIGEREEKGCVSETLVREDESATEATAAKADPPLPPPERALRSARRTCKPTRLTE